MFVTIEGLQLKIRAGFVASSLTAGSIKINFDYENEKSGFELDLPLCDAERLLEALAGAVVLAEAKNKAKT